MCAKFAFGRADETQFVRGCGRPHVRMQCSVAQFCLQLEIKCEKVDVAQKTKLPDSERNRRAPDSDGPPCAVELPLLRAVDVR